MYGKRGGVPHCDLTRTIKIIDEWVTGASRGKQTYKGGCFIEMR
jgi:hypothetical protein